MLPLTDPQTRRGLSALALGLAAVLLLACAALPKHAQPSRTSVSVVSHNRRDVDVYLLCGDRDARWLGVVEQRGAGVFEIPAAQTRCVHGLNFFLVVRAPYRRGYWVGPVQPNVGSQIELLIEKYTGLSSARLHGGARLPAGLTPSCVWGTVGIPT